MASPGSGHPTWDLPTRLFHWLLALGIFLAWLSHEFDWTGVHRWTGYSVLVLVVFRILWGFFGSLHSRFTDFVRSPATVVRYWQGREPEPVGHNPAGGWSVLVLLGLVLLQALTGLFNSDDLLFDGPLHHAVDGSTAEFLGGIHEELYGVILGFVGLHLAAIAWYHWGRGKPLLPAMISGGIEGRQAPVSAWRALLLLVLCVAALALVIYLAPEPELPWG